MNGAEILTRFTADTTQVDKATKNYTSGISGLTKAFTLSSLAAQGVSKAISVISQNMDSAISRFDTMNNFPKVMKNLGIGADEADESIKTLSNRLQGLPTTLNDAASSVQRLTSKNGDIRKSTNMFLALNNAILAGGASSQIQASALEQISQAYAKGKPDMMEWRTMMMAMPAQLKQVAIAMGYVDADALGESLRNGTTSMDDFMNTIIKLNTEGVGEFANFEEQARNATGGVATSITNMKTAVVRGITGMIEEVNTSLEDVGGLSGLFGKIGKGAEQGIKALGEVIGEIMPILMNFAKDIMPTIQKAIDRLMPTIKSIASKIIPSMKKILDKITPILINIGEKMIPTIESVLQGLEPIIEPIFELMGNLMQLQLLQNSVIMDLLSTILPPLVNILSKILQVILPGLNKVLSTMTTLLDNGVSMAWNGLKNIVKGFVDWFKNIPTTIGNLIDNIINFFKNLPYNIGVIIGELVGKLVRFYTIDVPNFINGTIDWFKKLPGRIWDFVSQIPGKIWTALMNAKDKALEGAKQIFDTIVNKLKELPGEMIEIGKQIVEGIRKGIDGAKDKLKSTASNFANGIKDGLKKAFGIHSPSKLMKEEIGINIGLGVVEGIDETKRDVAKAMNSIGASITGSMGLNPNTINNMNTSLGGVNVVVNANFEQDPLGQMVQNIKTFSGGAKNDYNYGMGIGR